MTSVKLALTICGLLAIAGCSSSSDVDLSGVRNGPQTQDPNADAPGGKLPDGGNATSVVIIDDTQAQIDQFAAGAATSIVQTVFR